jgi:hypothetical protein
MACRVNSLSKMEFRYEQMRYLEQNNRNKKEADTGR